MKRGWLRWVMACVVLAAGITFFAVGGTQWLSFESLKEQQDWLRIQVDERPLVTIGSFILVYVLVTALSLPGSAIMTLAAGASFGLWWGTVIASVSSITGATLAFLSSRYVLREWVKRHFSGRLRRIDEGVKRDGAWYLLTLRLIAVIPFFIINLSMGLTSIRLLTYVWASWVGMLAGKVVFVNAGTRLGELTSLSGILSPVVLGSFVLLAIIPWVARSGMGWWRRRQAFAGHRPPKEFAYDLVVIGGGSAGLVASAIASAVRARVALVERADMGGECLNTGCVPSKALIRCARAAAEAKSAVTYGIHHGDVTVDFAAVMAYVRGAITAIAPHDSEERFRGLGVEVVRGDAVVSDPWTVVVGEQRLTARAIIVATGASPTVPKIPGLAESDPLTSDSVWGLTALPARLAIIGGGPIGCELGQAFARLGSHVTIIHAGSHLLEREDDDIAALIGTALSADGVRLVLGQRAERVERSDTGWCVVAGDQRVACDRILVALGRVPRISGFGLDQLGVRLTKSGAPETDVCLRTTIPSIFACGDVTGRQQFTHAAAQQAWAATATALADPIKSFPYDDQVLPWVTYTAPECARVGLSERQATEQHVDVEVTRYHLAGLDRAITEGATTGMVKICSAPGSGKILGVAIVGAHAGETIAEFTLAMKRGLKLKDLISTVHAYPTWAEAARNAALAHQRAHVPQRVIALLGRYFTWRRQRRLGWLLAVTMIPLIAGGVAVWWFVM